MVDYSIVIRKLHAIGLSKSALLWILSYLSNRQQFVQVNDKQSRLKDLKDVLFGVPQGSVLGPVICNLYANDLQDCLKDGSTCLFTQRCYFTHPQKTSRIVSTE